MTQQTLDRLRELGNCRVGDPLPKWMISNNWGFEVSALCRDALAEIEANKVDAERWRALMSSARMHFMGSAGIRLEVKDQKADTRRLTNLTPIPRLNEPWHFGMEFWSEYKLDTAYPDTFERELMVNYVDAIRGK